MTSSRRTALRRRIVCAGRAHALLVWQDFLPIETAYRAEIPVLRRRFPTVGQVLALENRGDAANLASLIAALWDEILAAALDAVVIAVSPADAAPDSFYRRVGFAPSGFDRKTWRLADGESVEILVLDVAAVRPRATAILGRLFRSAAFSAPSVSPW